MIKTIYCMKNRLSGIFENPYAELASLEQYPEMLAQSLAVAPVELLERHKEYDLFTLGKFDTKSGEIVESKVEFVCSLEPLCLPYIAAKSQKVESHESEQSC